MPIYLIGFMGSGKTTVGKKLAKQLGYLFIDLDAYLEKKYQCKIAEVFEKDGEDVFRDRERQCLVELSGLDNAVVSTGGGTPCFFDNLDKMKATGLTIYLKASSSLLKDRLKNAKTERPLLKDANSEEELLSLIESKLNQREPIYNQAHIIVNAASIQSDEIVKAIEESAYWR